MSERFTNKSPGALTMEQAIAHHKKMIAEDRRRIRQARELAAQGRGGDTEIAHVTPGEIVLPHALQTPYVLDALRQAATEAGIPLDRLRVGSPANNINPDTGVAEFYGVSDEPIEEIVVNGNLITDDPSTNRVIEGLHPSIRYDAAKFINDVKDQTGQQLRVPYPGGFRTPEQQDELLASGRGVTSLPGGKSYHNYGLAFDITGLNPDGKTTSDSIDFARFAPTAKARGFEWGGDWKKQDLPHFQRTFGYNTNELRQMREPGATYPTIPGQRNKWP